MAEKGRSKFLATAHGHRKPKLSIILGGTWRPELFQKHDIASDLSLHIDAKGTVRLVGGPKDEFDLLGKKARIDLVETKPQALQQRLAAVLDALALKITDKSRAIEDRAAP